MVAFEIQEILAKNRTNSSCIRFFQRLIILMLNGAIIPGPDRFVKANELGIICCTDRILIFCLNGGLKMNFPFPNAVIQCPYSLLTRPLLPHHTLLAG